MFLEHTTIIVFRGFVICTWYCCKADFPVKKLFMAIENLSAEHYLSMAKSIPGWYTPSPCVTGIVFPAVKNHSTSRCFSGWSKNLWKQTSAEPSTHRCFDHFRWKNNGKSCHTKQSSIKHWWLPTVISPVSLLFTKLTKVCSFTEFQLWIVFSKKFKNTRNSRLSRLTNKSMTFNQRVAKRLRNNWSLRSKNHHFSFVLTETGKTQLLTLGGAQMDLVTACFETLFDFRGSKQERWTTVWSQN